MHDSSPAAIYHQASATDEWLILKRTVMQQKGQCMGSIALQMGSHDKMWWQAPEMCTRMHCSCDVYSKWVNSS